MNSDAPNCRGILFARQPVPGQVKTRLATGIGDAAAATLYEAFLRDCVSGVQASGALASLAVTPDSDLGWFEATFPGVHCIHQQGDDLGERMAAALRYWLQKDGSAIAVFGTDSPTATVASRKRTFEALEHADIVLSPDPGGGFWSIGARPGAPLEWLTGMSWGHDQVMHDACTRLDAAGISWAEGDEARDVDVPSDLELLLVDLKQLRPQAPHTRAALTALGLLDPGDLLSS